MSPSVLSEKGHFMEIAEAVLEETHILWKQSAVFLCVLVSLQSDQVSKNLVCCKVEILDQNLSR